MKKIKRITAIWILAAVMISLAVPAWACAETPLERQALSENSAVEEGRLPIVSRTKYNGESGPQTSPGRLTSPPVLLATGAVIGAAIAVAITLLIQKKKQKRSPAFPAVPRQVEEHNKAQQQFAPAGCDPSARWVEVTKNAGPFTPTDNSNANAFFSEPEDL